MSDFPLPQLSLYPLTDPDAPTLTLTGPSGSTQYAYRVVVYRLGGHTAASPSAILRSGPSLLSVTNYIEITCPLILTGEWIDVYRTQGGDTQGKIGTITARVIDGVQHGFFRDTGHVADATTPPLVNTSAVFFLGDTAIGSLLLVSNEGLLIALPPASDGQVLTLVAGLPTWGGATGGSIEHLTSIPVTDDDLPRGATGIAVIDGVAIFFWNDAGTIKQVSLGIPDVP